LFEGNFAQLNFSKGEVSFDTVFTTIGSITQNFRVFNPYDKTVRISNVSLRGGEQSNFRMNVDGRPGTFQENIEIAPKDSIFIFVEVTVDPNNESNPFVIEDYIDFVTNGNHQEVKLTAWGQNAHYFTPTTFNRNIPDFSCLTGPNNSSGPCDDKIPAVNVTWTDDLPYVIYGYVVVDSMDVLTIEEGVDVYIHDGGGIWVYQGGTIKIKGTKEKPVTFQGDRLEKSFQDIPGQWDRIWINDGGNNEINYAVIKNAFIGLQVENLPFVDYLEYLPTSLSLKNTIIENCSNTGLLSSAYNINSENLMIKNCGQYNVALQGGGNYSFKQCTFANYFNKAIRETPLFFSQNVFVNALGSQYSFPFNIDVYNSIIDGDQESEFNMEEIMVANSEPIVFDMQNTIVKTELNLSDPNQFQNLIINTTQPIFRNTILGDFALLETSVARDKGLLTIGTQVQLDLMENDRILDGKPDLGALEYDPN